jgi:hypothetical protein
VTSAMDPLDRDGLRALVRQVLSDVLPDAASAAGPPGGTVATGTSGVASSSTVPGQTVEPVSLRTDAELHAFVLRLLGMFDNPKQRSDLQSGRVRFVLAAGSQPGRAAPSRRVEKGAVTEAQVKDAAKVGATLMLGRRAVLTPLARDKARALGVVIEREA